MSNDTGRMWRAAVYIRISKENGDDTLENQRAIIKDHLKSFGNIEIRLILVDDGYTGLNINRPAFKKLLEEIERGEIDCVAVRDLSRLSRNYIDAGRYIHQVFPKLGVRFISVFEGFDFTQAPEYNISLMVGFRNLVNEEYLRSLSRSVKSVLYQGYADGKFLGASAVYGYKKSSQNRYQLEIDPVPARVVQQIFQLKLEGMSAMSIAEELNQLGAVSPKEYKRLSGVYDDPTKDTQFKWAPITIIRILSNRVYIGCLEQGKSAKPYFKADRREQKPRAEWIVAENSHEAIIPISQFEAVARLLLMDTRNASGNRILPVLSGFVRCGACGQNMTQQQVSVREKIYRYYVCSGKNPENKKCQGHRIPKAELEDEVVSKIRSQIENIMKIDKLIPSLDIVHLNEIRRQELAEELRILADESELYKRCYNGLYDKIGIQAFHKTELESMRQHYRQKRDEAEAKLHMLEARMHEPQNWDTYFDWIKQYRPFYGLDKVTRPLLAYLVGRIKVDGKKEVRVEFLHEREYGLLRKALGLE